MHSKPCPNPWCESDKVFFIWDLYCRRVVCSGCGLKGPSSKRLSIQCNETENLDEDALRLWNTRD